MPGRGASGGGSVKTWDEVVKEIPESELPTWIYVAKQRAEKEGKPLQAIMREIEKNLKD